MNFRKIIFTAMVALTLAACNDEIPTPGNPAGSPDTDRPVVAIPLDVVIATEDSNLPGGASRAVEDSETGVDAAIHDLWIMQFECFNKTSAATKSEAIDNDALLVYWDYIPDYDSTDPDKSTAKFVVSERPCFVVIFANTLNPDLKARMSTELKFSDVKQWREIVDRQEELFVLSGAVDSSREFPDNANHVIRFNGITPLKDGIDDTTPNITMPLRRNIARVDFNITIGSALKAPDVDFTIDSYEIYDVPNVSYYFTNGNWAEDFTTGCTDFTNEDGTLAIYPSSDLFRNVTYSNPIMTPAASLPSGLDAKVRFYLPPSQRGKYLAAEQYANEKFKPLSKPAAAMYLLMKAHYKDGTDIVPVEYRLYLGADLGETGVHDPAYRHDFNICANHVYTYNVTLNSIGDPTIDFRVENYANVTFPNDLDHLSNCYILNPSIRADHTRKYRIPVRRVDEFWGDPALGDVPDNCLSMANAWRVEVIWSDFQISDFNESTTDTENFELLVDRGTGRDGYFTVAVPPGLVGNVVVGLRKTDGNADSDYLWSWHLWITDYNPDREYSVTPGTYLYPVTGGNICRMGGEDWETGAYKDAFMMDRNLGATSRPEPAYPHPYTEAGLLYEYGRKDPFSPTGHYKGGSEYTTKTVDKVPHDFGADIPFIVNNPTTKQLWGHGVGNYNSATTSTGATERSVWLDPRIAQSEYPGNGKKSIFDPSPYGWIVPKIEAFSDISEETTNKGLTVDEYRRGFQPIYTSLSDWQTTYIGLEYWPNVAPWTEQIPEVVIYFHATGCIEYSVANFNLSWDRHRTLWTASYATYLYYYHESSTSIYNCHAVRCVKRPKH